MKLVIIRHGQTDANLKGLIQGATVDGPLNFIGVTQAEAAGFNLKDYRLPVIYSSTMTRAKETAEIIARYSNAKVIPLLGLEEVHFGDAEGMPSDEAHQKYKDVFDAVKAGNKDIGVPNGETVNQSLERALKSLNSIKMISAESVAGVVTHGGIMYNLYNHFFKQERHFENCEYFEIDI